MREQTGLMGVLRRTRTDPALRRESDMMGFYVSIALLAALVAGDDHARQSQADVLTIVWGTTVGLALAHWFAIVLSARLVKDPDLHHTPTEMFSAQLVVAMAVCLAATVIVLLLPVDVERLGARITAAVFLATLVTVESRAGGTSVARGLAYGAAALAVAFAIATTKWFIGY